MRIAVIDGLGGGLGAQIIEELRRQAAPDSSRLILALGTNSSATERMLRAGADRGASGTEAIRWNVRQTDVILGPLGIVIPHALMGEITPETADAVFSCAARKVLIPVSQPHFTLVGLNPSTPLADLVSEAVRLALRTPS